MTRSEKFELIKSPILDLPIRRASGSAELPRIVSLFCGAGGLDLGFHQAGFKIAVAFDSSSAAVATHKHNFKRTAAIAANLRSLGASGVLSEVEKKIPLGSRIGVIGGPPCQGFSRANNGSTRKDPRNHLAYLYARIVHALQERYVVEFIVFENVLGIRDKKHRATFEALLRKLEALDFSLQEQVMCAADFGVAQNRRRVLLSGLRRSGRYPEIQPRKSSRRLTVKDVIGSIRTKPAYFEYGLDPATFKFHPNHWTMKPKSPRFGSGEMRYCDRSFKLLDWDRPSPTVAYGNREIHVHPNGMRRLSVYEAMLLQGFPSKFVLKGNLSEQIEQVSNAVPPPLAKSIARAVRLSLRKK